jgi:lipopolysaccharide/colanic/teichoic acid biosynthesis glycosyltransferase
MYSLPEAQGGSILSPRADIAVVREPLLKRPLDWTLALAMLTVSLPVWLLIALAIKLEDRGPIFFRQKRWGRGGQHFTALKFRTMSPNADTFRQATHNDSRVTRVGKLLRAMGLDELPQIINILRGDMSFVGPRALAVGERIKTKDGT